MMTRLLASFAISAVAAFCALSQEPKPLRVLFVGNSYTYYNNLPELVSGLAASAGVKMETRMIARGGATLSQTWEMENVRHALHDGKWDFVVLQEQSQLGISYVDGVQQLSEPEGFWETVRMYDNEIRRVKSKLVLYLTWARRADPLQQVPLNYAYMTIAEELGATVAPVGMAWSKIREVDPAIELFIADGSHPTRSGSYLAACVLVQTLLGKRLSSMPARVSGHPINAQERVVTNQTVDLVNLSIERADALQRAASDAFQKVFEAGGSLPVSKPPPATAARLGLPAGKRPTARELSGVWRGKMQYYPWPATIELRLNATDSGSCDGQYSVAAVNGPQRVAGPIDSCRVTDSGVAFLFRDNRGLTISESFWGHYTGDTLLGWVEFRGNTRSYHMSGNWETHKEK